MRDSRLTAFGPSSAWEVAVRGRFIADKLIIDFDRRTVWHDGKRIPLSRTQWRILTALARAPGHIVERDRLVREVWRDAPNDRTWRRLRVHLTYLRRRLETEPGAPRVIVTEQGLGYRLDVERYRASQPGPIPSFGTIPNRTPPDRTA